MARYTCAGASPDSAAARISSKVCQVRRLVCIVLLIILPEALSGHIFAAGGHSNCRPHHKFSCPKFKLSFGRREAPMLKCPAAQAKFMTRQETLPPVPVLAGVCSIAEAMSPGLS